MNSPAPANKYLTLPMDLEESELDVFNDLASQPKGVLSIAVYTKIKAEESALRKSALSTFPRELRTTRSRRLFLCELPEYADTMKFIRGNIRRPAFKDHLKRLLLHGEVFLDESEECPTDHFRSPRELFGEPAAVIIKAIITDLNAKGVDLNTNVSSHHYNWAEIPPDEYPPEVQSQKLFEFLRSYWKQLNPAIS